MLKTLSEKEIKMLQLLEENGKFTNPELAIRTGLTEAEISSMRENLEKHGVILKYKAVVNWEQIESPEVIALIQVTVTPEKDLGYDDISKKISAMSEVSSCFLLSGSFDLLVEVQGPSLKEVAFFVSDKLAVIDGVERTRTNFLLKRYKQNGDILNVSRKTHRMPMVI